MEYQLTKFQTFRWFLGQIFKDIFKIGVITFLLLLMFEDLKNGFVSNYLNLKILLIICLVSGIITLFTSDYDEIDLSIQSQKSKKTRNWKKTNRKNIKLSQKSII